MLVFEFAVARMKHFAIFVASEPVHVAISSRCELVRCSDEEKPPRERKKEAEKRKKSFGSANLRKLDIPMEQSLSWHLSKNFNEDPLLRQNLKDGARFLSSMVNLSTEVLFQALLLRNFLVGSKLVPVRRAVIPRLDAAIASALIDIGIGPILEHPSFTPHFIGTLLDVCVFEKRQKLLPEAMSLLKHCCSDIMQGKTSKMRTFSALPRLLLSVSHGFGCSTSAAFDMLLLYIVPLANEQSNGGNRVKQMIVPRFDVDSHT